MNVISVEYPGYGIYRNEEPDADTITANAKTVFDYIVNEMNYDPKDIIIFGRSMGSGPACHLASLSNPCALILLSPYMSLREAVKSLIGSLPSFLVKERFQNSEVIKKVTCPTLIIHG